MTPPEVSDAVAQQGAHAAGSSLGRASPASVTSRLLHSLVLCQPRHLSGRTAGRIPGLVPSCAVSTCGALRHTRGEYAPGPLTPNPMLMRPTSHAHFQKPHDRCGYPVSVDAHGAGIPRLQSPRTLSPAAWPIPMEPLRALTPKATE